MLAWPCRTRTNPRPPVGFIASNLSGWSKNAIKWTRSSCRDFKDNQVRLLLYGLAYDLGNFLRRLALARSVKHRSLTTLREKLIKIGAKVVPTPKVWGAPNGRGGGATRVVREVSGPHPAVRRNASVGAAWLTRQVNEMLAIRGGKDDAARKGPKWLSRNRHARDWHVATAKRVDSRRERLFSLESRDLMR